MSESLNNPSQRGGGPLAQGLAVLLCLGFAVAVGIAASEYLGWRWYWCVAAGFAGLLIIWSFLSMVSPTFRDLLMGASGTSTSPFFLANQAAIESNLGKYGEALGLCERAIQEDPACKEAWYNKAVALVGLHRTTEAEEALREAVRIAPHFWQAWHNLAVCLKEQGKDEEAKQIMAKADSFRPA